MGKQALVLTIIFAMPLYASLVTNFERSLLDGDVVLPFFLAMGAGFLTSLSPCIYPLIPITLAIMGTKRYQSHVQGFLVALSYVFGMSLVYAALGALFASIGVILGTFMQNPLVIFMIATLFIAMSLSLFGVFNVVIPERVLTKLSHIGGQGLRGAFVMGMVAGLLAAPCTGPVLGFILTLIANDSNVVHGLTLMLAFSFGMGLPFLVLGTFFSAITRLPKSGPWMDNIKNFFGAIILGTAFYYISLASPEFMDVLKAMRGKGIVWLVLIFLFGIYVLALRQKHSRVIYMAKHCFAAILASFSIAALLTFDDQKLTEKAVTHAGLDWIIINAKVKDDGLFDRVLEQARREQRPVLVDFYADWCVACKQLDLLTLQNDVVAKELTPFVLIRIDASSSSNYITSLENRFKVTGLPTIVFINKDATISKTRILGFVAPDQFVALVKGI